MNQEIRAHLCLALDGFNNAQSVIERVREVKSHVGMFKVGLELYSLMGPSIIDKIHNEDVLVFLDLKLHDIPKTVERASKVLSSLNVSIFNVHACGGKDMMRAALEGSAGKSKVIGVTVLTSWSENQFQDELAIKKTLSDYVLSLAKLSAEAGLHGVVCSAQELNLLKKHFSKEFVFVTPGISGVSTLAGLDQKRVVGPALAFQSGSTHLVIGRAINDLPTPEKRLHELDLIHKDLQSVI